MWQIQDERIQWHLQFRKNRECRWTCYPNECGMAISISLQRIRKVLIEHHPVRCYILTGGVVLSHDHYTRKESGTICETLVSQYESQVCQLDNIFQLSINAWPRSGSFWKGSTLSVNISRIWRIEHPQKAPVLLLTSWCSRWLNVRSPCPHFTMIQVWPSAFSKEGCFQSALNRQLVPKLTQLFQESTETQIQSLSPILAVPLAGS